MSQTNELPIARASAKDCACCCCPGCGCEACDCCDSCAKATTTDSCC